MEITKHPSAGCTTYWDGVDFSQCFHDRCVPLDGDSTFADVQVHEKCPTCNRSPGPPLFYDYSSEAPHKSQRRSERLVSPTADSDLSKLESDVILSALASSILPRSEASQEKGADKGLSSDEAEDVIEDFKRYDNVASERWEKVGWVVGIAGGLLLLGVSIARAVVERDWRVVPFPVSCSDCPQTF